MTNALNAIFGEFIDFIKALTWRKGLLYLLAMICLGTAVTLMQQTNLGMSSWDALSRNFYEKVIPEYKVITPVVALVLMTLAHLILWKRPSAMFLFPLAISTFIGTVIDLLLLVVPPVYNLGFLWNFGYLLVATLLIAIGLNLMLYCDFPLPALDRFCHAIAIRFHLTFGQGKYIGEFLALLLTATVGLIFHTESEYFYLGFTTVFFILILGSVIDFVRNPLYRALGIQTIELFADDMIVSDIVKEPRHQAARAIIMRKREILLLHYTTEDFYLLPGGTKERGERLERCLRREVMEETGLRIKVNEQRLVIREYYPDVTYENHYFLTRLLSKKVFTEKINQTDAEKAAGIEWVWMDVHEAISLLGSHESSSGKGMHLMNREFIALITLF